LLESESKYLKSPLKPGVRQNAREEWAVPLSHKTPAILPI
jgi:hypothetical protein